MTDMTDFYKKIPEGHKEKVIALFPKRLEKGIQDEVLNYFTYFWLKDMGYGTVQTKKYLLRMARLYLKQEELLTFFKIYKNFNLLHLSDHQKR